MEALLSGFQRFVCRLALPSNRWLKRYARRMTGISETRREPLRARKEAVVGGITEHSGSRKHFGALMLGVYEQGRLR